MKWIEAEKEFESWFFGKTKYVHRFEDAREARGITGSQRVFTKGQPADYLVTDNGVVYWAEVKSSSDPASFPLTNIKKSQWGASIQVVAAGGSYYFFIRKEPEAQWFKIPAHIFHALQSAGNKSIKWIFLKEYEYVHV